MIVPSTLSCKEEVEGAPLADRVSLVERAVWQVLRLVGDDKHGLIGRVIDEVHCLTGWY